MQSVDVPIQVSFMPLVDTSITCFDETHPFPSTRYQGSKNKITDWIWEEIKDLNFQTVLDAFGGTGSVSHLLKRKKINKLFITIF
jgi:hypothetical protein